MTSPRGSSSVAVWLFLQIAFGLGTAAAFIGGAFVVIARKALDPASPAIWILLAGLIVSGVSSVVQGFMKPPGEVPGDSD